MLHKLTAEFLGTLFVVLIGCGTAVVAGSSIGTLGIAFAFGLALAAAHSITGSISGGHLNPAVSFAFWLQKKLDAKDFLFYVLSQLTGAILAGIVIYTLMMDKADFNQTFYTNGFGIHSPGGFTLLAGGVAEVLMTTFFVLTFLTVTRSKGDASSSILIGATTLVSYLFLTPFTNGSINPARSFGVALLEGGEALNQVWFFFLAPFLGAALAVFLERLLTKK